MAEASNRSKKLTYEENVQERAHVETLPVILFDSSQSSLHEWLEQYKPSNIYRENGFGWIAVKSPEVQQRQPDLFGSQIAWNEMMRSTNQPDYDDIARLAEDYNNTAGKWFFNVNPGNTVNETWSLIANSMVFGDLGKLCYYAKVSPNQCQQKRNKHIIMVYNPDFTLMMEVIAVHHELRKLGLTCVLKYKPDIYTQQGIYSQNPWKITPILYKGIGNQEKSEFKICKIPFSTK